MNVISKLLLVSGLIMSILPCLSQTNINTVISAKPKNVSVLVGNSKYAQTDYHYDDFGRIEQIIDKRAGGSGQNIAKVYEYDNMGRQPFDNLPFVVSGYNGTKIKDASLKNRLFYSEKFSNNPDKSFFYSETEYDGSPLGLIKSQSSPGEVGNAFPVNFEYRLNTRADSIQNAVFVSSYNFVVTFTHYGNGELTVKETKTTGPSSNEERISSEYKNKLGQVIATVIKSPNEKRQITYYLYDEMGRVCSEIPAAAEYLIKKDFKGVPADSLKRYCSITKYNSIGLPEEKWAPGKGWTSYVYDTKGRLIMTQEPTMINELDSTKNAWWFSKYDCNDRVVMSGRFLSALTARQHTEAMKSLIASENVCDERFGGSFESYTNDTYPQYAANVMEVHNVSYYDGYDWVMSNFYSFEQGESINNAQPTVRGVIGFPTVSRTRVIGRGGPGEWQTSIMYYDDNYNVIQTISDLYPAGREIVSNSHDTAGNVLQAKVVQQYYRSDTTRYAYNKFFTYDNAGRLSSIRQEIEGDTENGSVIIGYYSYDDLGSSHSKSIHNWDDETTYKYDLPGRLVSSQSNSFSYDISYRNKSVGGDDDNIRNGDIEQFSWKRNGTHAGGV